MSISVEIYIYITSNLEIGLYLCLCVHLSSNQPFITSIRHRTPSAVIFFI